MLPRREPLRRTGFRPKPPASGLEKGKSEVRARVTKIRPRSAKLAKEMRAYVPEMLAFLAERPWCERCGARSTEVHHRAGRGKLLREQRFWAALCHSCHEWVTVHPADAIAEGWLLRSWEVA